LCKNKFTDFKSLLFHAGKTLLARAIAGEAKVPFFFASGSGTADDKHIAYTLLFNSDCSMSSMLEYCTWCGK
jgi:hypothetical protein